VQALVLDCRIDFQKINFTASTTASSFVERLGFRPTFPLVLPDEPQY
jgi:hypothetical protein